MDSKNIWHEIIANYSNTNYLSQLQQEILDKIVSQCDFIHFLSALKGNWLSFDYFLISVCTLEHSSLHTVIYLLYQRIDRKTITPARNKKLTTRSGHSVSIALLAASLPGNVLCSVELVGRIRSN